MPASPATTPAPQPRPVAGSDKPGTTGDPRGIAELPDEEHFALSARVSYPDGSRASLYVNPYTGTIQGKSPNFDFRQFTRALHGWWLVPFNNGYSWGWYLVSLLGLPMLASLVTGLVVYKRFWKGFFKPRLRISQGARIFWGDFHRLSGIWSIWFIAIISITGTWFLIQAILADNHITLSSEGVPPVIARNEVPTGHTEPRISLDEAVRIATEGIPSLDAASVSLPGNAYSPIYVEGRGWYPSCTNRRRSTPIRARSKPSACSATAPRWSSSPNPCAPCTPAISAVSGSS